VGKTGDQITGLFNPTSPDKIKDGKPRSVKLSEMVNTWNTQIKPLVAQLNGPNDQTGSMLGVIAVCTNDDKPVADPALARAKAVLDQADAWQRRIDGPHQVTKNVTLGPETDYEAQVTEKIDNGTQTAQYNAKFSPGSNILTLSLGTLLSQVQQRSYANAKDPTNPANNILSVNGTGKFTPLGLALLNYRIPKLQSKGEEFGLSLSSGLVLRFGDSDVKASSIGWFGGPSIHLYHRLFISAGVHIGQFGDFPPGLRPGGPVPTNYGDLNPVNRSTARFAFAVTYQTSTFSKGSTKATTANSSAASTTPAAGKKPAAGQ
jgi:hypothetical protein